MSNIKVNRERSALSPEEMKGAKNFDALLQQYQAMHPDRSGLPRGMGRKRWLAMGLAAVSLTGIVLFGWMIVHRVHTRGTHPLLSAALRRGIVNPPIPAANVMLTAYSVDAAQGAVLSYPTGTHILVPAHAFLDEKGAVVQGAVRLQYREWHNPVDIMLSGIPMNYDSGGQKMRFESAGMMQMLASQNGHPLSVNPEAMIQVNLRTTDTGSRYNLYYLDTLSGQWVYKQKVRTNPGITFAAGKQAGAGAGDRTPQTDGGLGVAAFPSDTDMGDLPQKPVEPVAADPSRPVFNIAVNEQEFPEIAVYKNVQFQVTADEQHFNADYEKLTWNNAVVKPGTEAGTYLVTFERFLNQQGKKQSITFKTRPVFTGGDLAAAQEKFHQLFAAYQEKLEQKRAAAKAARGKDSLQFAQKVRIANQLLQAQADTLVKRQQQFIAAMQLQNQQLLNRAFNVSDSLFTLIQVDRFGFWNNDAPYPFAGARTRKASFVLMDEEERPLVVADLFFLIKSKNSCCLIHPGQSILSSGLVYTLNYDPEEANLFWAITTDFHLAVLDPQDFEFCMKGNRDELVKLKLKVSPRRFSDATEINQYLMDNSFASDNEPSSGK